MASRTIRRLSVLAVALVGVAGVTACEPLPPPEPGSVLVGCGQAGSRVTLTASSHLDPACVYAGFDIRTSGVTLDCQGAVVRSAPGAGGRGILVESPAGVMLTDVTIRNCKVEGFLNSIKFTRDGFRTLAQGEEYEHTTQRMLVEKTTVSGSRGVGIYVDGYVSDTTIQDTTIKNAGGSGIYLETGSRRSNVLRNNFLDNGFIENGPNGQAYTFNGLSLWFWGIGREGLSIDGSYENVVEDNVFLGNSAGGIFMYKNCGEYPDRDRYFERRYPSNDNRIARNTFIGGTNGVWVGSRMGENTLPMECTDPAYVDEPGKRVVLDYAADNEIVDNTFHEVTHGIRVEDDGNRIERNHFVGTGPTHHAIIVGTPYRSTILDHPVTGTVVADNVSDITGNPYPYRWVTEEADTTFTGNTALGQPVGWCQAPEPPRSIFVMAIAIAVAGPGGTPPATTPDLTQPAQPALPDCPAGT
ncbi:MAG: right-handed parallel beta-helix repeat-containing protein [Actinobacteria bacterium]|nr:right-handed parallel beta-helix repeat-containing protein [Actinomycetota bacterium]